ncbi:MAG: hypothetical protein RR942_09265 [Romboutsia sp.]
MFKPDKDRLDYGELLSPPKGFKVSRAVGTTYSLDLETMISIPISLCFSQSIDNSKNKEKLHIVDSIVKCSKIIKVYCQQGQIHVPKNTYSLYSLLEDSIAQVLPDGDYSFHPKIWIIRFEGKFTKEIIYRVIVLSRNLTFDRSWDVSVCMDGIVESKKVEENKPIIDFMKHLTKYNDFEESKIFIRDLNKVRFDLKSSGFDSYEFLPMGIENYNKHELFEGKCKNQAIISPFLSKSTLDKIGQLSSNKTILLSRENELNKIDNKTLQSFECYNLKDSVIDGEEYVSLDGEDIKKQDIHAKMYIRDIGRVCNLYLGSTNCSHRGFNGNIEFLLKLSTSKRNINCNSIISDLISYDEESCFQKFIPSNVESDIDNEDELINNLKKYICKYDMKAKVVKDKDLYNIELLIKNINEILIDNKDVDMYIKPLHKLEEKKHITSRVIFKGFKEVQLSSFYIIDIIGKESHKSFILKIDTEGIPYSRDKEILKDIIQSPQAFLNYMSFILGDKSIAEIINSSNYEKKLENKEQGISSTFIKKAMFEKMLQAASREPDKIKDIKNIIKYLDDEDIVPDEFKQLCKAFDNFIR